MLAKISNEVFVTGDVLLDLLYLLFMHLDQLDVLASDVIVVLLHLTESVLVVEHELVDVLVLAFLDLMDFDLHAELKLITQFVELRLVARNQRLLLVLECALEHDVFTLQFFFLLADFPDVCFVSLCEVFLESLLVL